MDIEQEIKEIDFSKLSKIKDSLLQNLIQERTFKIPRVELYEDDLDYLAAAGNNCSKKISEESKKNL